MSDISFFTPINFNGQAPILETIDGYFSLNEPSAKVTSWQGRNITVSLEKREQSWVATAVKVASFCTGIIPLLMLLAKALVRSYFTVTLANAPNPPALEVGSQEYCRAKLQEFAEGVARADIKWQENAAFTFKDCNNWLFIMPKTDLSEAERELNNFDQSVEDSNEALEVIEHEGLDLIKLDLEYKKFELQCSNGTSITINGVKANLQRDEGQPIKEFNEDPALLIEHFRQLTRLLTKLPDFIFGRDIPILRLRQEGNKLLLHIDLVKVDGEIDLPKKLLYKIYGFSSGLFTFCSTREQVEAVIDEAMLHDSAFLRKMGQQIRTVWPEETCHTRETIINSLCHYLNIGN